MQLHKKTVLPDAYSGRYLRRHLRRYSTVLQKSLFIGIFTGGRHDARCNFSAVAVSDTAWRTGYMNLLSEFVRDFKEYDTYDEVKEHFELKIPEEFNFPYDVVDRYAKEAPEKRALVWCDDSGEEHVFTFRQISEDSQKAANFLSAHGIKKGDFVMLILRRRYEFWWFILALHRIGAVTVPATDQLLQSDIEYRTDAAPIKMIISYGNPHIQEQIERAMPASPYVKELVTVGPAREGWTEFYREYDALSASFPRPQGEAKVLNDDISLTYFTSGTSGYPKMVQHNFLYPLGHITTAKYWQNVQDDGLHLTVAETGWAKTMWGKLYGQWLCGSAIFVYDLKQFNADALLKKMEHYKVTTFCAPPTVYRFLVRQDLSKYDLSSVSYYVTAGEALNPEVYSIFLKKTGKKIHEGYGQTETPILIANFVGVEPRPGSMGKAAPGFDITISDADGNTVPPGETGEIIIRLAKGKPCGVMKGYYKNDEGTERVFSGGIFHTGDTAHMDEDGYIYYEGRNDDVIKSSGYRISPFEVESILMEHPAVLECAVTGIPDERRGQLIKATIKLSPGYEASPELETDILSYAREHTAMYKVPRKVEFVKELPKTISGKIQREKIREKDLARIKMMKLHANRVV